ncbi:MAG: hypothetical protein A2Y28_04765 [Chlamydiae bacterium GWC2_50_10]|nr:MAG: hypothetical protein A2Z85_03395 [Chlamydiae bacterium GWA2_50_15]OGN54945.1 MAG: hypothetical protein A2Y28_04765 [Chlamydiae bacterium GWC2_50_10]HAZ15794.1 hypothetical protein [Parachlamydiales bacterium]HCJ84513.1 hypothetical protein [Parachlamydiales bacterium]
MHTTSVDTSQNPPLAPLNLSIYIHDLWNKGVSLDYIFMLVMTNSQGSGVIDGLAASLQGITDQNKLTNQMQGALASILAFLAKLSTAQNQNIDQYDLNAFASGWATLQDKLGSFSDPGIQNQLMQAWDDLYQGSIGPDSNYSDPHHLFSITDLQNGNFQIGDTEWNFIRSWLNSNFNQLGPTSVLGTTETAINTANAAMQGMSTEETTEIQSDTQLIMTYDKIAQDAVEQTNQSKSSMVQRQIPGS